MPTPITINMIARLTNCQYMPAGGVELPHGEMSVQGIYPLMSNTMKPENNTIMSVSSDSPSRIRPPCREPGCFQPVRRFARDSHCHRLTPSGHP